MLNILKTKKPFGQEAKVLYAQCLDATRRSEFYTHYALPDTMDARFDLLLLHLFLIIERSLQADSQNGALLNQALFDTTFADMDQTLREMGIGDMGIPKRMRKMMTGFNGRMHSYSEAMTAQDNGNTALLNAAIIRNVYGQDTPTQHSEALTTYILKQRQAISALSFKDLLSAPSLFNQD